MKDLSKILKSAKEGGFFLGFKVWSRGGVGMEMSHLLFDDNTLIF